MLLGKVLGPVVSTARLDTIPARQLLRVELDAEFGDPRNPLVAIDSVSAGPGDRVLVLQEGTGARQVLGLGAEDPLPVQMVIVAIVDQVSRG